MTAIDGAPAFFELGGRTFSVSPYTDADYETLSAYVRKEWARRSLEAIPDSLPEEQREKWMMRVVDQSAAISWTSDVGAAILITPIGVAFMLWVGIRRNHPEMTPESIQLLYGEDKAQLRRITRFISQENKRNPTSPAAAPPPPVKTAQALASRPQKRKKSKRRSTKR